MILTNIGLVEHAKKALNEKWGYVYGTYSQTLTENLLLAKLKQYPDNVAKYETFIRQNWMGRKVTDCVGLIKSYIWWSNDRAVYDLKTDVSANGMFNKAIIKGDINTMPEIPGLCVRKDQHIGVYIGNGQVIESKGTKYGVVQTPLKGLGANGWTHWLKCPFIDYVEQPKPVDELKQALEFLAKKSGIDVDHWYSEAKKVKYLDSCFIKLAKGFGGK